MRKNVAITLIIIASCVAIIALAAFYVAASRPNPPLKTAKVAIGAAAFNAEIASSTLEQMRGLSGRDPLAADQAMLFTFGTPSIQHFWMKDMKFSLDMIWIGGNKVLGFAEDAEPQPDAALWNLKIYNSPDGTDNVLEVDAGTVQKDGIKVGDPVVVSYPQQ